MLWFGVLVCAICVGVCVNRPDDCFTSPISVLKSMVLFVSVGHRIFHGRQNGNGGCLILVISSKIRVVRASTCIVYKKIKFVSTQQVVFALASNNYKNYSRVPSFTEAFTDSTCGQCQGKTSLRSGLSLIELHEFPLSSTFRKVTPPPDFTKPRCCPRFKRPDRFSVSCIVGVITACPAKSKVWQLAMSVRAPNPTHKCIFPRVVFQL